MNDIAAQVCASHGMPKEALFKKQYTNDDLKAMKQDFICEAKESGYSLQQIADFMDYAYTSVANMYSAAMMGQVRFKYERLLQQLEETGAVHVDDFDFDVGSQISYLRNKKGYKNIYKDGDKFKKA